MPVWLKTLLYKLGRKFGRFAWVRFRAKRRIGRDLCPECASVAGIAESCEVCEQGKLPTIPTDPVQRAVLWEGWLDKHPEFQLPGERSKPNE